MAGVVMDIIKRLEQFQDSLPPPLSLCQFRSPTGSFIVNEESAAKKTSRTERSDAM